MLLIIIEFLILQRNVFTLNTHCQFDVVFQILESILHLLNLINQVTNSAPYPVEVPLSELSGLEANGVNSPEHNVLNVL